MPYLPLPGIALRVAGIVTFVLIGWILWGSITQPEALWAPGDLHQAHQDLQSCRACHLPFRGVASERCAGCHQQGVFKTNQTSEVNQYHQLFLRRGESCLGCHIEHQGRLARITVGTLLNPHGDIVFRKTGAKSCNACHNFYPPRQASSHLRANLIVSHLLHEGEGAHVPGKMKHCQRCHGDKGTGAY